MDCMQASDTSLTNRSRSVMEIRHTAELNNNIPDKSMKGEVFSRFADLQIIVLCFRLRFI